MGVLKSRPVIYPDQQALVFVVREDGEPGLYLAPGVSKAHAVALFTMMTERLLAEIEADAV